MQTYIVFGAAGGIGKSVCDHLAKSIQQSGHGDGHIIAVGRDASRLEPLLAIDYTEVVVSDYSLDSIENICTETKERFGSVTAAINCVGSVLLKPIHLTSETEFNTVMQTNIGTAFSVLRSACKVMQDTGGSIILCASAAAQIGLANHEAIAAAKGAIIALARSAAATYATKKIRVNVVSPGLTKTPMTARITNSEAGTKASLAMHPLGRLGEPDDIARAITFLSDPINDWITGQVLGVDGGLGMLKVKVD